MSAVIRKGAPADAAALAALANRTFIETFVEHLGVSYPEVDLGGFLARVNSLEAMERRLNRPDVGAWVAEDQGRLVGYAVAGEADLDYLGMKRGDGMIHRLYLLRPWQGQGLARALMDEALAWLEQAYGPRPWLTVFSQNIKAQRFYARYGFEKVGEFAYPVGDWTDLEFVMRRR